MSDGASYCQLRDDDQTPATHKTSCPDCGPVVVVADVWESGKPVSGECPECGERLYFA
jgi:ribosomal protein S27AE